MRLYLINNIHYFNEAMIWLFGIFCILKPTKTATTDNKADKLMQAGTGKSINGCFKEREWKLKIVYYLLEYMTWEEEGGREWNGMKWKIEMLKSFGNEQTINIQNKKQNKRHTHNT